MSGISPHLLQQIRTVLLECGPFNDNSQIRDLFTDARLSPWRFSLPSRDNTIARVEAIIAFLSSKHRADDGQNALVLLLRVLSDRLDIDESCQPRLAAASNELAESLSKQVTPAEITSSSRSATDPFANYENGLHHLEEVTKTDPDAVQALAPLAQRLRENISRSRRYGDTTDRRAERAEIIDNLDTFARAVSSQSFNDWCNKPS